MSLEFRVSTRQTREALQRAAEELALRVRAELGLSLRRAKASAESTPLFQDRSGRLRGSIRQRTTGRFTGELFTMARAPYAAFVENGTRSHEILPKRSAVLAFRSNGRMVFRRRVQHPGTKPRPFMDAAARSEDLNLTRALEALINFLSRA